MPRPRGTFPFENAARQSLAQFAKDTGGRVDSARTSVPKFGRSEAGKSSHIARRQARLDAVNDDFTVLRESGRIKLTGVAVLPPAIQDVLNFEGHALEQMGKRKISLVQANDIAENAILAIRQRNGAQHFYYSDKGFIVIRQDGSIGTVGWMTAAKS